MSIFPTRLPMFRYKEIYDEKRIFIDVSYMPDHEGLPDFTKMWSIFISGSKDGTDIRSYEEDAGILLSGWIQAGGDPHQILEVISGGKESLATFALRIALENQK